jgi:ribosomal-protein-serine acetyltransferase
MKATRNNIRFHFRPWVDFTQTVDHSKGFISSTLKQFSNNDGFQVGIWYKGKLAGIVRLHKIDWSNKSASIERKG